MLHKEAKKCGNVKTLQQKPAKNGSKNATLNEWPSI